MRFFRSPQDLSEWVKTLGAKKAATILVNLPRVGQNNAYDIMETSNRIVTANDENAADVLFSLLKSAGITESTDIEKSANYIDNELENVKAANELLANKVISSSEHSKLVKQATYLRDPAVYDMPLRICPKLPKSVGKGLISTYNCRHYCLDSIVLDDDPLRVYCGELLWRRHVADKFSSDQQDRKTGELYGGYINERFYKFPDAGTPANPDVPRNGGNPMSLKPGERTRVPRPEQWSIERRMQEAREKGSTTDHVLGKTASKKVIEAGGFEQFSEDLYDVLSTQAMLHKDLNDQDFINMIRLDPDISKMMNEEGMTSDDLINLRNDKGTQFMINNRNLTNTSEQNQLPIDTASSWFGKMVQAQKITEPKKSEENVERKIIMAAGKYNFTKISSNLLKVDDSEKNVFKAFSMAIDLKNEGIDDTNAAIKIADATGFPIAKSVNIQTLAIKKMAAHVSDAYKFEPEHPKSPITKKPKPEEREERTDEEIQSDAADLGLLE
jgi:hypothetical protein